MFMVLAQMAILIASGALWQALAPRHIPALAHRRALTDLVFYILLPAMVIDVIWQAPLDMSSMKISLLALSGLTTAAVAIWLLLKVMPVTNTQRGALILAATFPNVTYLGLPVLDQVLGSWSNAIILQYDLFACTPVLMTVGMLMAGYYGSHDQTSDPLKSLVKIPPLWAVSIAVLLNLLDIERPEVIHAALQTLSGGVVPLMLIALGMSIRWQSLRLNLLPLLLPVAVITLFLAPAGVWFLTQWLSLSVEVQTTVILSAAMPTMVFGIVICERYGLDTSLYAAAVTLTTVLCMFSLPLWFYWIN